MVKSSLLFFFKCLITSKFYLHGIFFRVHLLQIVLKEKYNKIDQTISLKFLTSN